MMKKVCILGGSGFVGTELSSMLSDRGYTIKLLTRNAVRARHLRVLPSLTVEQVSDFSEATLTAHTQDCDVLINLIGILNEKGRKGHGFHKAHVDITRAALRACEVNNTPRFLQLSALNADPNGPSHYLRSKGQAETYLNAFAGDIDVTIFKPSVIFGPHDSFMNRFAGLLRFTPGLFPLACGDARFAPVYVGDLVQQMVDTITDKSTFGKSYDLCGPKVYTLKELVEYVIELCAYPTKVVNLPLPLSKLQAMVLEFVPGKPFSIDNFNSMKKDSVSTDGIICSTSLEAIAPGYIGKANS